MYPEENNGEMKGRKFGGKGYIVVPSLLHSVYIAQGIFFLFLPFYCVPELGGLKDLETMKVSSYEIQLKQ